MRCVQAIHLCTATRAKTVVAGFTMLSLTAQAVRFIAYDLYDVEVIALIYPILFFVVLPVVVLVINVIVVREIRRVSKHSAVNLGRQQHHHSTSPNSAVPTVMMVITSFVYVLLSGTFGIFVVVYRSTEYTAPSPAIQNFIYYGFKFSEALSYFIFAYNFYVYLITGKHFRSDLRKLLCYSSRFSCLSFSAAAADNDANNSARITRHALNDTRV